MSERDPAFDPSTKENPADSLGSGSLAESSFNINERALLRKLDWRLLPPVTVLYLLSFLDRSNSWSYPRFEDEGHSDFCDLYSWKCAY